MIACELKNYKNREGNLAVDKRTPFSHRLSFRQTQYTLVVAFFMGLIFSALQTTLDYRHQDRAIDEEITSLLEISSAPASRIAYNIDTELAQELLHGLIHSPAVSAEIRDDSGQLLASIERDSRQDQARWISDTLFGRSRLYRQDLRVDYDPDEPLGYLQLEIDTFSYGDAFLQRALMTFATGLIKGFAMALILLLLFYRMVTSPLMSLTRSLGNLRSHQQSSSHLTCPEGHNKDEIGLLVEEINNLLYSMNSNTKRRYRAERQLRDHLTTLESGIVSRTAELNTRNRQLVDSNKKLEAARQKAIQMAQARDTLLASMSHEIRTPLGSLLGLVDLARENTTEPAQKQRLELAHVSGKQLLELLNDILDFSRFESGKLVFESLTFNIHEKIESVTEQFSQQANQKNLTLQCVIDTSVPTMVKGDPTRLQQIITNLISNAIKFTPIGYVAIDVTAHTAKDSSVLVDIVVSDTGIGVPEDKVDMIFQPFAQASTETTRLFGGSGLGLTLSKNMAEALGGKLHAQNRKSGGSEFALQLPYQTVSQQPRREIESTPLLFDSAPQEITLLAPYLTTRALYTYASCSPALKPSALSWFGPWRRREIEELSSQTVVSTLPEQLLLKAPQRYIPIYSLEQPHTNTLALTTPIKKQALPQLQGQLPQQQPLPQLEVIVEEPSSSKSTILVVEDNPTNLMVTEGMLEQMGFEVRSARNGQQCLDICQEGLFDLILMDCNMPVMNGYDASRALRRQEAMKDIPIIALTANALEHDKVRCLNNGMQDYISKPLDRKVLQAKLRQWIAK